MYSRFALPLVLAAFGLACWGSEAGCWLLIASQITLFSSFLRERLTGFGAFVFMYVLFFAVRPSYIILENDYDLMRGLFGVDANIAMVHWNLVWASAGLISFAVGGRHARRWWAQRLATIGREERERELSHAPVTSGWGVMMLLLYQAGSLLIIMLLATRGTAMYGSALGAYMYDIPAVLHGGQIASLMMLWDRYLRTRHVGRHLVLSASIAMFVIFTLLMRDMSMFRGFYITGLMIAGIAMLAQVRSRVGYVWLVVPILAALPVFRVLGQLRHEERSAVVGTVAEYSREIVSPVNYWRFFDGNGDMNIFDSFVAASEATPTEKPYILSWLYVPFHLVPRKLWAGKPSQGLLQDHSFSNDAPYSPGIAGYFVLDGGRLWMLLCMAVLGFIVSYLDIRALRVRLAPLRWCIYGIVIVNGMFLTRFLLWQWFYQMLYMLVPCVLIARFIGQSTAVRSLQGRMGRSAAS